MKGKDKNKRTLSMMLLASELGVETHELFTLYFSP
jgi:hypothetical protein